jgi:hypothetical protein
MRELYIKLDRLLEDVADNEELEAQVLDIIQTLTQIEYNVVREHQN